MLTTRASGMNRMIAGTRYVMKIPMPRFSANGSRSRARAYPAGTAVRIVIVDTQNEISIVLTIQEP